MSLKLKNVAERRYAGRKEIIAEIQSDEVATYWFLKIFMKQMKAYLFFYQKIFIPSFLVSLIVAFMVGFSFKNIALSYLFFAPFFHFMIYEIRNKDEYFFYANFGLSRKFLWILTLSVSLILEFLIWKF